MLQVMRPGAVVLAMWAMWLIASTVVGPWLAGAWIVVPSAATRGGRRRGVSTAARWSSLQACGMAQHRPAAPYNCHAGCDRALVSFSAALNT